MHGSIWASRSPALRFLLDVFVRDLLLLVLKWLSNSSFSVFKRLLSHVGIIWQLLCFYILTANFGFLPRNNLKSNEKCVRIARHEWFICLIDIIDFTLGVHVVDVFYGFIDEALWSLGDAMYTRFSLFHQPMSRINCHLFSGFSICR